MPTFKETKLNKFCQKIGYTFQQPALLREALTHRSFSAHHNERLEFLGDGVLNCAIAALIFQRFTDLTEGDLSRLRANLVNQQALSEIASDLQLGELISIGDGEIKSGGHRRPSILANAVEAVLGAIFVDGGYVEAEKVIRSLYKTKLENLDPTVVGKDPKTLLQEYLQRHKLALPAYSVISTLGKAHKTQFVVECNVPKFNIRTIGEGSSRRRAEQEAAKHAYEQVCANN